MHINVYINSVMLGNIPDQLSNNVRNLGFAFDNQLNVNKQMNNLKTEVTGNLINLCQIAKFIDKNSKICIVFIIA